jgi:hypothetical protein
LDDNLIVGWCGIRDEQSAIKNPKKEKKREKVLLA